MVATPVPSDASPNPVVQTFLTDDVIRQDKRLTVLERTGITLSSLDARVTALEALTTPTAWTAVTFTNSWANVGGFQTAQYRKIGDVVYLRGPIAGGIIGSSAFTLPVGFRPPANLQFAAMAAPAIGAQFINVNSAGTVVPTNGTNAVATLDGISFSVTA